MPMSSPQMKSPPLWKGWTRVRPEENQRNELLVGPAS
jgi:hypothetical protein